MQGKKLLHKFFNESAFLHKKAMESLTLACEGLLSAKKLSVAAIGRAITGKTSDRHCIKRIDRLVSNPALENNKDAFYKALAKKIVPETGWCTILVDTSCLTADTKFQVIRAALALDGRAVTLFEIVYENGTLSETWEIFLERFDKILPKKRGRIIIITDAGFHNKWFHLIRKKKWDFIGRIRQDKNYTASNGNTFSCKSLHKIATLKPMHHGTVFLSKQSHHKEMICDLYSVKKKPKGRKSKNKNGKTKQGSYSKAFAKGQTEPWILASSLPKCHFNPEEIVRLYSYRMQIEESFRDIKNSKYRFSFKNTLTRNVKRLNALVLIGAIVNFIMWSVGVMAEQKKWHLKCQSNTSKKRCLSLPYLGAIVINSKYFRFKLSEVELALRNLIFPSKLNIMERQF